MSHLKEQVVTITCKLHECFSERLRKLEQRSARIEGENLIIIMMLGVLLTLIVEHIIL